MLLCCNDNYTLYSNNSGIAEPFQATDDWQTSLIQARNPSEIADWVNERLHDHVFIIISISVVCYMEMLAL